MQCQTPAPPTGAMPNTLNTRLYYTNNMNAKHPNHSRPCAKKPTATQFTDLDKLADCTPDIDQTTLQTQCSTLAYLIVNWSTR